MSNRIGGTMIVVTVLIIATAWMIQASSHDAPSLPKDMSDFQHINSLVVTNADSPIHGIHHFYMNGKGMETFKESAANGAYPEGTRIVGKVFKVVATENGRYMEGDLAAYTYMEKAPEHPMAEKTGGWIFMQFDAKKDDMGVDAVKNCFGCHKPHEKTDFVMSKPLK